MGINHITLVGEVTRKPELRYDQNGVPNAEFKIAVKRPPRQDGQTYDVTDYIRVVAKFKLAETIGASLDKGVLVSVEGRMRTSTHETPDGQRRKEVDVDAMSVETIGAGAPRAEVLEEPSEAGPIDDRVFSEDIPF